jgi:hypothetical protein
MRGILAVLDKALSDAGHPPRAGTGQGREEDLHLLMRGILAVLDNLKQRGGSGEPPAQKKTRTGQKARTRRKRLGRREDFSDVHAMPLAERVFTSMQLLDNIIS